MNQKSPFLLITLLNDNQIKTIGNRKNISYQWKKKWQFNFEKIKAQKYKKLRYFQKNGNGFQRIVTKSNFLLNKISSI